MWLHKIRLTGVFKWEKCTILQPLFRASCIACEKKRPKADNDTPI